MAATSANPSSAPASPPRRRRRWPRVLGTLAGLLLLLFVGSYFLITSQAFLRRIAASAVERSLGGTLTVEQIDFNVFSRLGLRGLVLTGPAPERDRVAISRLDVTYDLFSLLGGEPHITRLEIDGAQIALTRLSDGRLALLRNLRPSEPEPGEGGAARLDTLRVLDVSIALTDRATGLPDPLEATLTIDTLTGQNLDTRRGLEDLELAARVERVTQGDHTALTGGRLTGTADLTQGDSGTAAVAATFEASGFEGTWRGTPLTDDRVTLRTDVETSADGDATIRMAELALERDGRRAATVTVTGQINAQAKEGTLSVALSDVTDAAFELLMARPGGVDFGRSTASGQVDLMMREGGQQIGVDAHMDLSDFSVDVPGSDAGRTPSLDLRLTSSMTLDQARQTLRVASLGVSSDIGDEPLLDASLSRPMTIVLGSGANEEAPPASIDVTLHGFDVGRMHSLLPPQAGERLRGGIVRGRATIRVDDGGRVITAAGSMDGDGLVLAPAGAALPALDLRSGFDLTANPSQQHLTIRQSSAEIRRPGAEPGTLEIAGDMDFRSSEGTIHVRAEQFDLTLPGLALDAESGVALTAGTLDTNTVLTLAQGGQGIDVTSQTSWEGLNLVLAAAGAEPLPVPRGLVQVEAQRTPQATVIESLSADLGEQGNLTASGRLGAGGDGEITATLTDLNLGLVNALMGAGGPVRIDEGDVDGQATVTRSGDTTTIAFEGAGEMRRWTMTSTGEAMPSLGARGIATVAVHPVTGVVAEPLRLAIVSDGREAGQIQGRATVATGASPAVEFDGTVEGVDLAAFRPFLGDAASQIRSGRLGYRGTVRAASGGLASRGTATLEDLSAAVESAQGSRTLEAVGLQAEHDLEIAGSRLLVRRAQGTLQRAGSPAGSFNLTADLDLESRRGQGEVTLQQAAIGQFLAALGAVNADVAGRMIADGRQTITFDPQSEALSAQGQLTLSNLSVNGEGAAVEISNSIAMDAESIQATGTRIATRLGNQAPQPITIDADIRRAGGDSQITISGGDVNITPLYEMMGGSQAPPPPGDAPAGPATLPPIPDAGEMNLSGRLTFERLTLNTVVMLEPRAEFTWRGRQIDIAPFTARLAGPNHTGQLDGSIRLFSAGPGTPGTYDADLTLTQTDLDPLLQTFAPGLAQKVTGSFIIDQIDVRSGGALLPEDGVIQLRLADGGFNNVPILTQIADLTRVDVVRQLQFFEGGLTLQARGDRFVLERDAPFWVRGNFVILTATGDVLHAGRQELDFTLGLNSLLPRLGELMSNVAGGVAFPVSESYPDYRIFPLPIHASGPWGVPRVSLGAPQLEQLVPNILGGLLRGESLPQPGQAPPPQRDRPGLLPNLPIPIPGQERIDGLREDIEGVVPGPLQGLLGGGRQESPPQENPPIRQEAPPVEEPQLPPEPVPDPPPDVAPPPDEAPPAEGPTPAPADEVPPPVEPPPADVQPPAEEPPPPVEEPAPLDAPADPPVVDEPPARAEEPVPVAEEPVPPPEAEAPPPEPVAEEPPAPPPGPVDEGAPVPESAPADDASLPDPVPEPASSEPVP